MANYCAVIGIGNPGKEYLGTRHNVGFEVLDIVACRESLNWKSGFSGLVAEWRVNDTKVFLLKPATYVNRSGDSVARLASYYSIEPDKILVVVDDYNLALGKLRIRSEGSAGGHNGLTSIISTIGQSFHRLRVGIGEPKGDSADFVLSRFSKPERETMDIALQTCADAVVVWLKLGIEEARRKYNGLDLADPA